LTLLMAWVRANNAYNAFAFDDLAIAADLFY
jgi:hypothetical protein